MSIDTRRVRTTLEQLGGCKVTLTLKGPGPEGDGPHMVLGTIESVGAKGVQIDEHEQSTWYVPFDTILVIAVVASELMRAR